MCRLTEDIEASTRISLPLPMDGPRASNRETKTMKVHRRKTYQSGADRMLLDQAWHSSRPLSGIQVGDILRVKNMDTLEVVDWMITQQASQLGREEAKAEWFKYPFGTMRFAEQHGYFPFVLFNL